MLLRFTATNYLSIKEEVELSFVATSMKEHQEQLVPSRYARHGVLPVLVLYGANASGKSNLLSAIGFMQTTILRSFEQGDGKSGMHHKPFLLDDESQRVPSTFVVDFVLKDIRHQYGFTISKERVEREWLFAFPKQVKQTLFTRQSGEPETYVFGRALPGSNRQIQSITRPNTLFLSVAAKADHSVLADVFAYFKNHINIQHTSGSLPNEVIAEQLGEDTGQLREVASYLSFADTGISDIKLESRDVPDIIQDSMRAVLQILAKDKPGLEMEVPKQQKSVKFGHFATDGSVRYLDYVDESLGTKYMFTILLPMLRALKSGSILILDEITTSLHTLLSRKLVAIFKDRTINPKGAQLVFSTHDTNLLAPGLLRRDQVWLAEKSREGVTKIFPLSDFKTKNTDNLERGYVQGRFGAIPYLRESVV